MRKPLIGLMALVLSGCATDPEKIERGPSSGIILGYRSELIYEKVEYKPKQNIVEPELQIRKKYW